MADDSAQKNWRPATQLVRGGTNRSNFAETNEGVFMTSGYIYETAEQAQRAFKGEEELFPLFQPDREHVSGSHELA